MGMNSIPPHTWRDTGSSTTSCSTWPATSHLAVFDPNVNDDAACWLLRYLDEVDRACEDQAPYTLTVTVKKVVFDLKPAHH
jgi:hypothetical protein